MSTRFIVTLNLQDYKKILQDMLQEVDRYDSYKQLKCTQLNDFHTSCL